MEARRLGASVGIFCAMRTVGDLRAYADERLFEGDGWRALHAYALLVRLQANHPDARLRVADALLLLGRPQEAAQVYTIVARHEAHSGYPLRALISLKVLTTLEPELGGLLRGIAELYCQSSPRLQGRSVRVAPGDLSQGLPEDLRLEPPEDREGLVAAALQVATDLSSVAVYPEALPPVPLFSALPEEAFGAVLGSLKLVRARAGQVVVREGDVGHSFYVVARGHVAVERQSTDGGSALVLATLHEGAIFGEMALVSAAPRSASVRTLTDADLLEFDRQALAAASGEVATIALALDKFMRERLLNNLLATSALFRPLDRKQRLALVRRFTAHDVVAGTIVIREGEPGQGLYVVLGGKVDVTKVDGDEKVFLASLGPGEVFGEISLLQDALTTATVTAAVNSTVLFLAKEYFQRLVEAVTEIRDYVEGLGDERLMDTRILLSDPTEDDEMLLI